MATPCGKCARLMGDLAVICPHCGEAQTDRDPRELPDPAQRRVRELTKEEAQSLLAIEGVGAKSRGLWASFFLPHPRLARTPRLLDIALIICTLPLGAGLLPAFGLWRWRGRANLGLVSQMVLIGVPGILGLLLLGWNWDVLPYAQVLALLGCVAMVGRTFLGNTAEGVSLDD